MPSLRQATVGLLCLADLTFAALQLEFTKVKREVPQHLRRRGAVQASLQNAQDALLYLVNVTVGTPPQSLALQLDTGSSDIWVPWSNSDVCQSGQDVCSNGAYNPDSSSTFNDLDADAFQIQYVDGTEITGDYISETFGIGGVSITNMTMGVAKDAQLPDNSGPFQGIVGVGFPSGESIADGDTADEYPNIIDMLKTQGHTDTLAYSLWLNDLEANSGSILFGGVDTSKYTGDLTILPIQPDSQSGTLTSFTVVLDNMNVVNGSNVVQYSRDSLALAVVLDSGTTLTYLPEDIANDIASGVGAGNSEEAGVYVPCSLGDNSATLSFGFGNSDGPKVKVPINEFVIPFPADSDGNQPTLSDGTVICQWGILSAGSSPNLFGDTFLRSAYVVYDLTQKTVGIAQTVFNASGSDVKDITASSVPGASSTATGQVVTQTFSGKNPNNPTKIGASATGTNIGTGGTATFNLGSVGTHHKGAAGIVSPPSSRFVAFMAGGILLVSGLSGALMVLL